MKFSYYPGCTLHGTAREYDESTRQVSHKLGIELAEIPDWNCCGATALAAAKRLASYAVPLRNLAIAEQMGHDVAVACNACFLVLSRAHTAYREDRDLAKKLDQILAAVGRTYRGTLKIRHTLDIIAHDVGPADIERQVVTDLSGLRAVPYYGCQIGRPDNGVFDPEFPDELDALLAATGVKVPRFDKKTKCCGAALMTTKRPVALEVCEEILAEAVEREADVIVATCPMCQMNLDAYQDEINSRYRTKYRLPVLYFTQVLGLALGIAPNKLGLGRHMVPTAGLLARIGGAV